MKKHLKWVKPQIISMINAKNASDLCVIGNTVGMDNCTSGNLPGF